MWDFEKEKYEPMNSSIETKNKVTTSTNESTRKSLKNTDRLL